MAIVLRRAFTIPSWAFSIIDSIEVYVDDVLVASASDESSVGWAIQVLEGANLQHNDAWAVIQIGADEALVLSAYAPTITEGPSNGGASIVVQDVTLYIPGEILNLNASPYIPTITENVSANSASATLVLLSQGASVASYAPTITEGPSGSPSSSPSATLF